MIDTTVRRLLVGGTEDDFKVGTALMAKKGLVREGLYAFEDVDLWTKRMRLDNVKLLQTKHPTLVISGSIALFLQGCRSSRWEYTNYSSDIDVILPYYYSLEDKNIKKVSMHNSGCDFSEVYLMDDIIKIDTRIDSQQRYDLITYDGFTYRVSDPLEIIQAKIKYSKQSGDVKHRQDLYDIIGKTTFHKYLDKVNNE